MILLHEVYTIIVYLFCVFSSGYTLHMSNYLAYEGIFTQELGDLETCAKKGQNPSPTIIPPGVFEKDEDEPQAPNNHS